MRAILADLPVGAVRSVAGRLAVDTGSAPPAEIVRRLAVTPGIANVWCAKALSPDLGALDREVDRLLSWWRPVGRFRVEVRRADKTFPVPSPEVAASIGARIVRSCGAPVDLKKADTVVYVLIVRDRMYLALQKIDGCGGLPVSTGGRVLLMLSGGIDSPVAGIRMMRRGCRVQALHFHSVPYLSGVSREKARMLCSVLARGQGPMRLDMVAFGEAQSEIVRVAPSALRVGLYRRMMMRMATAVVGEVGASAIVTGESLGQVASQTLTNMTLIAAATDVPVLRPLVGMDKREITDYAQREGTYEVSIVPDQDCCTLFVPKHPSVAARSDEVADAESRLDIPELVRVAVESREHCAVEPAWSSSAQDMADEVS
jgi:thiamine biosynthesis protein ThiI